MKVILDIKDDMAPFVMELLKNFKFVKAKPLTPYKEEVLTNLADAVAEMKLIKAGKLKGQDAKDLLNEL